MQSACQQCTLKCGYKTLSCDCDSLPCQPSEPWRVPPVIMFETLMLESKHKSLLNFSFGTLTSERRKEARVSLSLSQVSLVRGASSPGSERSRWPPELRSALKKPGVCSNYSHKGTLVMEMPLSWIERSASRCLERHICHLRKWGLWPVYCPRKIVKSSSVLFELI